MNSEDTKNIINGLRALRLSAFRKNATHNNARIQVEECTPLYRTEINSQLQDTFTDEQNIPQYLIPLSTNIDQKGGLHARENTGWAKLSEASSTSMVCLLHPCG